MSDDSSEAAPDRRASWVALRTLRQRAAVVGRTEQGSPVYEIASVRVVLPPGASHFKRLMACSKCGRELTGAPVLAPDDLDRSPNPVFCDLCVRSSTPPRPVAREAAPAPQPAVRPAPEVPAAPDPALPGRLAALEAQLADLALRPAPVDEGEMLRRLSEEVAGVRGDRDAHLAALSASVAEVRAELRNLNESNRSLVQMRSEVNERIDQLAAQVQSLGPAVTEYLGHMRSELESDGHGPSSLAGLEELRDQVRQLGETVAGTSQALAEPVRNLVAAQSDIQRIDGSNQALVHAKAELDEKVRGLAAALAALQRADALGGVPAQALADLRASLAAAIDAGDSQLRAALTQGLGLLRSEIAAIRERSELVSVDQGHDGASTQAGLEPLRKQLWDLQKSVAGMSEAVGARELAELRASVTAALDTGDLRLQDALTEGLAVLRSEIAVIRGDSAAVTALIEAQHHELREAMHDVAQETLVAVAEPLRDLVKAREDFGRRLDALQQQAELRQHGMEALCASADARDSRLHALEQKIRTSVQRAERPPAPQREHRPGSDLLESLEEQLREAEERLRQL